MAASIHFLQISGKKRLDTYRFSTCKAEGTLRDHVQCVITDIEMPIMDGHRLTKLIKDDDETKNIPVIIFSQSSLSK